MIKAKDLINEFVKPEEIGFADEFKIGKFTFRKFEDDLGKVWLGSPILKVDEEVKKMFDMPPAYNNVQFNIYHDYTIDLALASKPSFGIGITGSEKAYYRVKLGDEHKIRRVLQNIGDVVTKEDVRMFKKGIALPITKKHS